MFSVNERPKRLGQPYWYGREAFSSLILCTLIAGPGFFSYALIQALYRDLPTTRSDLPATNVQPLPADAIGQQYDATHSADIPRYRLSMLAGTEGQSDFPADNPLMAYLRLRSPAADKDLHAVLNQPAASPPVAPRSAKPIQSRRKTFRTVCVRLCDGYYFPIGFNATADQFAEHEAACQSRCGSPARLFVFPNPGGTPAQMRDLAGNAYLKLKNAFRYHVDFNPSCSCQPQPWTLASKRRHLRYAAAKYKTRSADVRSVDAGKPRTAPRLASNRFQGMEHDDSSVALAAMGRSPVKVPIEDESLTNALEAKHARAQIIDALMLGRGAEIGPDVLERLKTPVRRTAIAGWSRQARNKHRQMSAWEILRRNLEPHY
ncbi:MAG: DUF2865 domain-containing protein [Filomicrobium sp.]